MRLPEPELVEAVVALVMILLFLAAMILMIRDLSALV